MFSMYPYILLKIDKGPIFKGTIFLLNITGTIERQCIVNTVHSNNAMCLVFYITSRCNTVDYENAPKVEHIRYREGQCTFFRKFTFRAISSL